MPWLPKQLVLVPYDFSEEAAAAIETALQLVASPGDVRAVYAAQDISPLEMGGNWNLIDDDVRREHSLAAMREKLAEERYRGVLLDVVIGDPGRAIPQYAAEVQAELIVVPSHGRTGIQRALIGSVAERIVRHALCPVLVLRKA
jgi:nucleotide-binding universal stress UspA family protein